MPTAFVAAASIAKPAPILEGHEWHATFTESHEILVRGSFSRALHLLDRVAHLGFLLTIAVAGRTTGPVDNNSRKKQAHLG